MNFEITASADRDIKAAVKESARLFGRVQASAYAALVSRAIAMVAEQPEWPGSISKSELRPGVRSFHLELAAGRQGAASHYLYYRLGPLRNGTTGVVILRVLHERMDPNLRLT